MKTNTTDSKNSSKKIELIKDAYLEIIMFFWEHTGDDTPIGEKAKEWFNAYHDSVIEIEDRFQGNDFKSAEDSQDIEDELDFLYYRISDIDPTSPVLWSVHLVLEMIENGWHDIRMPR